MLYKSQGPASVPISDGTNINQERHYFAVSKQVTSCALGEPNWLVECKSKAEEMNIIALKTVLRQYQSSV
jgi:hypothetical protein